MGMVGIMRLVMIAAGLLLAFASFWYYAAKKMTLDLATAWCLVGVVIAVIGAVPPLSRWLAHISGWTGVALFCVGGVCLWAAFLVCRMLSRLLTQNQELTMQISLLRGAQQQTEQRNTETMKKVLFVINTTETEGAEKVLPELRNHLDSGEFPVDLYVLQGPDELIGQIPEHVPMKGKMNVVHIDYERGGNRLQVTDGKNRLLCDLEPEAISKAVASLLDSPERRESLEKAQPVDQPIGELLAFLNEGEQRRSS